MKRHWITGWELCRTDGRGDKGEMRFTNFRSAKRFARAKVGEIYMDDVIARVRCGSNKVYCNIIADFLQKYFTEPNFPKREKDIPSANLPGAPMFDTEEEPYFSLHPGEMASTGEGVIPRILTNMVLCSGKYDLYYDDGAAYAAAEWPGICYDAPYYAFQFDLEGKGKSRVGGESRVNSAFIKLYVTIDMDPLDIAGILKEGNRPMSGKEIADMFFNEHRFGDPDGSCGGQRVLLHRLQTLIGIGTIRKLENGNYEIVPPSDGSSYYIDRQSKLTPSVYPLAILDVLEHAEAPLNMQGIADEIYKRYGRSVKRQTVGEHLKRLTESPRYDIQNGKTGYFIHREKEKA